MKKSMLVTALLLTSLTGCVTVNSDCPMPTKIAPEIQERAAKELEALPSGSAIGIVLAASLDDRDKLRACRSIR